MQGDTTMSRKYGPALTWDQLADLYPGRARIMPMDSVFDWAARQRDRFFVHPDNDTIHLLIESSAKSTQKFLTRSQNVFHDSYNSQGFGAQRRAVVF
jgi:hypothetical protein